MSFKVLDFVRPLEGLVPEVELPLDKLSFDDKIVYTIGVAALYLLASLPLTGVDAKKIVDPFYWTRWGVASDRGTLLELGLVPFLTSAFFWQILAGSRLIKINFNNIVERQRFQTLQKISAIALGAIYSLLLVFAGYFEPIDSFKNQQNSISFWSNALIVVQLTMSTGIVTLLCEILEKGYGFGPGIMSLLTITTATKFSGALVGIVPSALSKEPRSEGVLIQLVTNFFKGPFEAIYSSFNRTNEINLTQIYLTVIVVGTILFLSNFRQEVSIKSSKVRSMVSTYPIRLFYCGSLPLVFTWTIIYNLNFIVYIICQLFGPLPLLAQWENDVLTNKNHLVGGLLYLISPSGSSNNFLLNILRPLVFTILVTFTSTLFSINWYTMAGSSGKDLARQFKDQEITVVGHRDATVSRELNKMISQATLASGLILGGLVGFVESLGVSEGTVMGVSIGVLSGLAVLEVVVSDLQQNGAANTQFAQVFGV